MPPPPADQEAPGLVPDVPQASDPQADPATATSLSLKQAEVLALKNNPQISVARLSRPGFGTSHAGSAFKLVAHRDCERDRRGFPREQPHYSRRTQQSHHL